MYEYYYGKVYNYIFFRLLNKEDTEDLLSETFIKAFEHRESYDAEKAKLSTWLFTIAKNTLFDFHRKSKQIVPLKFEETEKIMDIGPNSEEKLMQKSDSEYMAESLSKLREIDRTALYLKYFMDYDYKEIAGHLKISEKNASVLLTRSLQRLKTVYEK